MAEKEPTAEEPTTGDRTESERLANAAERARIGAAADKATDKAVDADDAADQADKTDMGAVGDDGQVFGG